MKKFLALLLMVGMILTFGHSEGSAQSKILVAYFSRVGEEYGVSNITKGNTAIVAEIIAQKTGADLFEIKPVKPYPNNYKECTEIAQQEKSAKARPASSGNVNLAQYDTIFIGYPIWWGDMPMVVYTFLENNNFSGKTIIPFCTHGGSGLAGTERNLKNTCPNSTVLSGFAISGSTAQNNKSQTESAVSSWLKKINMAG